MPELPEPPEPPELPGLPLLPDALAAWARLPGPTTLLAAIRTRAQRGRRTEAGTLTGLHLTGEPRRQVGQLLGMGWELSGRPVRLQDLAARLADHSLSVLAVAEAATGSPIEANSIVRDRAAAAAAAERVHATSSLVLAGISTSHAALWLADPGLSRSGELAGMTGEVAAVWQRLPHDGPPVRLAQLAADLRGDAHAMDSDQALGRAVARLAAVVHGLDRPQRAGRTWREAWAAVNVLCDGVSSRVLALNLPLHGGSPAAGLCAASPGEPVWLTLRSLRGGSAPTQSTVFVCENPTVVEAAADSLGRTCPPLVCTDGIASGAALDLLAELSAARCLIRFRADIDAAGFVVADQVRSVAPHALPWRFDTPTYTTALGLPAVLLDLRAVYDEHRIPLHEERILDLLLSDLLGPT